MKEELHSRPARGVRLPSSLDTARKRGRAATGGRPYENETVKTNGAVPRASARHECPETMAPATRLPSSGLCARRREVHRWDWWKRNGQEGRL